MSAPEVAAELGPQPVVRLTDWSCVLEPTAQEPVEVGWLDYPVVIVAASTGQPVKGATVAVCPRDSPCETPVETSGETITLQLPVPEEVGAFEGHLEVSGPLLTRTLVVDSLPIRRPEAPAREIRVWREDTLAALAGDPDGERGHLLFEALDCRGAPAEGVRVEVDDALAWHGPAHRSAEGGLATDASGEGGLWSLSPGIYTARARLDSLTLPLGEASIRIEKDSVTLARLRAGMREADLACLADLALPPAHPGGAIPVRLRLLDAFTGAAVAGATVRACRDFDAACAAIGEAATDEGGRATLSLDWTSPVGFTGYFEIEAPGLAPTLYRHFQPLSAATADLELRVDVVRQGTLDSLATQLGPRRSAAASHLLYRLVDCAGRPTAGATHRVDGEIPAGAFHVLAGSWSPNADATDPSGRGGVVGLPPGFASLVLSGPTGEVLGAARTIQREGWLTAVGVGPSRDLGDLSCLGQPSAPELLAETVDVWVYDEKQGLVPGADVRVCASDDPQCVSPLGAGVTTEEGFGAVLVLREPDRAAYVEVTAPGYVPGISLIGSSVDAEATIDTRVVSEVFLSQLLAVAGLGEDPSRGHALVELVGCGYGVAEHGHFIYATGVDARSRRVSLSELADPTPSLDAPLDPTSDRVSAFLGLAPGALSLEYRLYSSWEPLGALVDAPVRAGWLTTALVAP